MLPLKNRRNESKLHTDATEIRSEGHGATARNGLKGSEDAKENETEPMACMLFSYLGIYRSKGNHYRSVRSGYQAHRLHLPGVSGTAQMSSFVP